MNQMLNDNPAKMQKPPIHPKVNHALSGTQLYKTRAKKIRTLAQTPTCSSTLPAVRGSRTARSENPPFPNCPLFLEA